ncbi:M28 family peptidase [Luteibaculum oceani]|uniref:M28 family peptidase n=1 Tax=Luteibaculum oceani TaxID=1294296 RepID=A0A5C6UZL5_9FLAO|nr:M28 family peptidase [Luteibaculum oceani]TXC78832.1 M28 family peptidase [Luteibaculum oceani]
MKKQLSLVMSFFLLTTGIMAQTGFVITNATAENVISGNYNPANFNAGLEILSSEFPSTVNSQINPDSLKAYIIKLASFKNRNTGSDTLSDSIGIGAARRWVHGKFESFTASSPRLIPAYFQFNQRICDITQHRNIIAVQPGTDTTDKSIIVVEGHIDSRCEGVCDIECDAEGVEDNASGTALVMELARVMGNYKTKRTIVYMVTIGEEQGLFGAAAFAEYCEQNNINVRAVFNNDVIGGIICGKTASPPGCTGEGDVDSTSVRIFSHGATDSPSKGLARFAKMQYQDDLLPIVSVPMELRIMSPEDRGGRGGDHIPFRQRGYPAIRYCAANEHGDASIDAGYVDRQHTESDVLGVDTDGDLKVDSFFVDFNYLARNGVINGASAAAAANGPLSPSIQVNKLENAFEVIITPAEEAPSYKIGVRAFGHDFHTIYETTKLIDTIPRIDTAPQHFISACAVDAMGIESLFSNEERLFTPVGIDDARGNIDVPAGIRMEQNRPNPFDEATYIVFEADSQWEGKDAIITIRDLKGKVVKQLATEVKFGNNEVLYRHGYGAVGTYLYSLEIEGKSFGVQRMIFAN